MLSLGAEENESRVQLLQHCVSMFDVVSMSFSFLSLGSIEPVPGVAGL